ncbi:sulfatase [Pelagicoccus mobilis]|uniref:Sulfatase n=1 Tax=Pelagicoccus mobilis TaxID=415221 RepID=A0A934S4R9_9BACT|nr:sulfatase [Pelagicoccus mobilis]MBK1879762.1 sulfatase [Pelagicoccus mobilis]
MIKNKVTLRALASGLMLWAASHGFASERPNVMLILVDDLKPTLGAYGDEHAISPNIDRLANMGMRFDLAYCNQSVCMASRYNLLLGSRSTSTGFYRFGTQFREVYPDAVTLPQHFMNNGYHVESMGKVFHIGHGNTNDEASWSIPHHKEKVIEYVVPESTNRQLTREEVFFQNSRMHFKLPPMKDIPRGALGEAPDVLDEAYADGRVATHAINRLRTLKKNPDQPFFMAVGFARPHLPFSAPKKYWDMYDAAKLPMPEFEKAPKGTPAFAVKGRGEISNFKPFPETGPISDDLKRYVIHGYYASMSYVDAQIGRVIDELKRLKMEDNTIIVLWGDHGWHLGDHGSWTKHSNFEQANRIPYLIVAPGVAKPGSSTTQLAETVDIYPTLAELAGLPAPKVPQPIDGVSMVPVLKDSKERIRDHAYHSFAKRGNLVGQAIRTDRYRMVRWVDLNEKESPIYELYDYEKDPLETVNLAESQPEVLATLERIADQHPFPSAVAQRGKK